MKKIFAYEAAALILIACVLLPGKHRSNSLLSPADKSSLRDAVGEPAAPSSDFNGAGKDITTMARQAREQQAAPFLTCSAHVPALDSAGKPDDMAINIFKNKDSHYAKIVHQIVGRRSTDFQVVSYSQNPVRAGLTPQIDPYKVKLSPAESLIVHAMVMTSDPKTRGIFSVDFDLNKARSAQVYQIGEARLGSASVVVAKDEKNAVLGAFLGGFVVVMCK